MVELVILRAAFEETHIALAARVGLERKTTPTFEPKREDPIGLVAGRRLSRSACADVSSVSEAAQLSFEATQILLYRVASDLGKEQECFGSKASDIGSPPPLFRTRVLFPARARSKR